MSTRITFLFLGPAFLAGSLMSLACTSSSARLAQAAVNLDLQEPQVLLAPLPIVLVRGQEREGEVLHVYIEGDGIPWIRERWVASDPSPQDYLMLRLMAEDPSLSTYLGRPCYHGLFETAECKPWYWTDGRYSEEVVASLAEVLREQIRRDRLHHLVLIGHSGGGTLAMLLAERLDEVEMVVTLAGNLDPDAWCELHGYSPLSGSLNSSLLAPLDPRIRQLHLAGEKDTVMPPKLIEIALENQPEADLRILGGCDHTSCWETIWPTILAEELGGTPGNLKETE